MAPTSEGKTYPVEECIKFFPRNDVYKVGSMSTKVLVRDKGILVDNNLNPIEDRLRKLRKALKLAKHNEEKEKINEEIAKLYEDAKTLIDLRGKILVFFEPPHKEVWDIIKPILSHDAQEIEYPFVNQTDRDGHYTKRVVVKGWPSCIFCSARDESKWEIWPEIKSRFLISSPNMIPKKYKESIKLIASKYSLPNLIQQKTIISDIEMDQARHCILLIKQKINELRINNNNKKNSVWIPYYRFLQNELPANKGTDVRLVKRIFSLLNVVPIVKLNLRKLLVLQNETSVIVDLNDLKEVLSITQSFDGIPKYKIDYFDNIFYPLYKSKTEPDSNVDNTKKEERQAVTVRQLCILFKEKKGKSISTDRMKKTYLDELIDNGLIDYDLSNIDARQYIYYPLVEPTLSFSSSITTSNENNNEIMSSISNLAQFDYFSQIQSILFKKIIQKITETWLFSEIMRLIKYRIDLANIRGPLADYLNNHKGFQLLNDNHGSIKDKEQKSFTPTQDDLELNARCYCNNNSTFKNRLTIRQFTKTYTCNIAQSRFDIKRSFNHPLFGIISPLSPNLPEFDNKDNNTKNIDSEQTTKNENISEYKLTPNNSDIYEVKSM